MSGLMNASLNNSSSSLQDSTGRTLPTSFSGQSGAASPVFHPSGVIQGLHSIHGNFNVPSMSGTIPSRHSTMNNLPSGGVQQLAGSPSGGRFASNNLPITLSQLSHGSSHVHSGLTNRGGMSAVGNHGFSSNANGVSGTVPGILPTSMTIGNRNAAPGLGISPILGNLGPRISGSIGNMVGGGNIGKSLNSAGGISVPGLGSHLNLSSNGGSGNLGVQGPNRLMSGVLSQGSSQLYSMMGSSYPSTANPFSQSHAQAVNNLNSMGMLNEVNPSDSSPFDINLDFPQLSSRPSSAGGPQGQLGSLRKQNLGPVVQQNQEFSIQNEDFPALPGYKGGSSDYPIDLHQKEQLHDHNLSMMQPQHLSMGRSAGFNIGGAYLSHQPQQQQQQHVSSISSGGLSFSLGNNQDFLHLQVSDVFPASHPTFHSQTSASPSLSRPLSSPSLSGVGYNDQLIHQYQQQQNQSQFRLQQLPAVNQSFRDHGIKPPHTTKSTPDPFGLLGLLSVVRTHDHDLASLALGIDLTTLGLNLNSTEDLNKTFASPWSNEPAKGDPEFSIPRCYYAKPPPALHLGYFSKFNLETLFYIFYSMPKDQAQLYAAHELYNKGWVYHKKHQLWLLRTPNIELLVKTQLYERGSYHCFDPNTFEIIRKDNVVLHYEMLEKLPTLPSV